jgi:hypothetical protein
LAALHKGGDARIVIDMQRVRPVKYVECVRAWRAQHKLPVVCMTFADDDDDLLATGKRCSCMQQRSVRIGSACGTVVVYHLRAQTCTQSVRVGALVHCMSMARVTGRDDEFALYIGGDDGALTVCRVHAMGVRVVHAHTAAHSSAVTSLVCIDHGDRFVGVCDFILLQMVQIGMHFSRSYRIRVASKCAHA